MQKSVLQILVVVLSGFSVAAYSATAQSQSEVLGVVTDNTTNQPIVGASVSVQSKNIRVLTDSKGAFSIPVSLGDVVEVAFDGYDSQKVEVENTSYIRIALQKNDQEARALEEVVMVGSRNTSGRIATETPVPVDVIDVSKVRQTTAKTDITSLLNMMAPSFNYNKQSGSDGADAVDLASLRGLNPDQTLVLINGKRRHQTAFVALLGTRGRGNSGTDLNAIPESSIERIEILRDGASAQYGSDAIAGVINIILKKDVKKPNINVGWAGYYDDVYNASLSTAKKQYVTGPAIDGNTGKFGANYGLSLGKKGGFVNATLNLLSQGKTFRQAPNTDLSTPLGLPVNTVRRAFGDASVESIGTMLNAELPIAERTTLYAFGGYNFKKSNAYAFSRNFSQKPERFPTDANGNIVFVPDIMHLVDPEDPKSEVFYNPLINVNNTDASGAVGIRGSLASKWDWDVSNTLGYNNFHYYGEKTFNVSLGPQGTTKNSFDDGGFNLLQNTLNAGMNKRFNTVLHGLEASFGAEYRFEQYSIFAGEADSYKNYSDKSKASGAQGFPGFQPSDARVANRSNLGVYAGADLDITEKWLLAVAARGEYYTDFGALATYKVSTRYKLAPGFNVRGSFNTGYRAPSLQQINFSNIYQCTGR